MHNQDTEVLFPTRVIPTLRSIHGEEWRRLIDRIQSPEAAPSELYAFVLMMVRQCGCVGCNADSFRAMRGCTACAKQTAKRLKGTDREIVDQYRLVLKEVETYLQKTGPDGANTKEELSA